MNNYENGHWFVLIDENNKLIKILELNEQFSKENPIFTLIAHMAYDENFEKMKSYANEIVNCHNSKSKNLSFTYNGNIFYDGQKLLLNKGKCVNTHSFKHNNMRANIANYQIQGILFFNNKIGSWNIKIEKISDGHRTSLKIIYFNPSYWDEIVFL